MTDEDSNKDRIDRRTVLKGVAAASAAGFVGVPAFSGSAVAQTEETLYLSDTGGDESSSFDGKTKLFEVDLVDGKAQLSELTGSPLPTDYFTQVDAIAATPDGTTIDVIDKNSAHLGRYTVSDDSFEDKGPIDGISGSDEVVLATYSPDGTLYAAGQSDGDELFAVDPGVPETTSSTGISGVDVQGADIAFDAQGTLYLFSSADGKLYTVEIGTGNASEVGDGSQSDKGSFTGLAIRDAGKGDLVGSDTTDNKVVTLDRNNGSEGTSFEMYLGDSRYAYGFGDMTVGELCVPCESGDELLVKYEWDGDEFVIGDKDDDGSTTDDEDENIELTDVTLEDGEPQKACFTSDYCNVEAIVKAGTETQTYGDDEGEEEFASPDKETDDDKICVTGIDAEDKDVTYAISNVRFYCEAPEDTSVGNSGDDGGNEDNGNGNGNGNKGNGKGK